MASPEIEKDLVRWRRGKWLSAVLFVFAIQLALMLWASQKPFSPRQIYPGEPKVAIAEPEREPNREWLEQENPFLFAGASRNGFSGEAWLRKPDWTVPTPNLQSQPEFLRAKEARKITYASDVNREFDFALARHRRPSLPLPLLEKEARKQESELVLTGFNERKLAAPLAIPVQFHTDVLASTVVEAMIDRDGLVISARLMKPSGSTKADSEALALTGRVRFTPSRSGENIPDVGKLIFEWFTLHLSDTNNLNR